MTYRDESIEGRFLSGETEAHGEVSRWIARILALPRFRMLRSEWADLHQDVLGRVLESLRQGRFDETLDFRVYVQGIARYTARETLLRRLRSRVDEYADPPETAAPAEAEDRVVERRAAADALRAVGPECRRLFRLYFYDQRSYAEIAREIDVPVGTVKSRIFRCLREARHRLGGEPDGG